MIRILFTGGGTGGHITPIIAVAEELKKISQEKNLQIEMRYFGQPYIYQGILESAGVRVSKIFTGKVRRYLALGNFLDIPKFFLSFPQLLWKIFFYMPDVLFSKGGPGSLPVVLICWFYRIPVIIHESDTVPGLSNQISGKYAQEIALSFESAREFFSGNIILTGSPVRPSLLETSGLQKSAARTVLGFTDFKPLILFISGSQGATRINDFVLDNLPELIKNFQVLHQTGIENFDNVKKEFEFMEKDLGQEEKNQYKPVAYFENNLKEAYLASDIVVSRAGSTSIFELAAFGKPSILIPLPEAAGNHQVKNAYEYAGNNAAIVIETDNLTPNVFMTQIKNLISDPSKMTLMSEAAKKFAKPDAARIIAQEIVKLGFRN